MAVKVDIVLDWSGDLGPLRLAGTVAALLPPRLFQRDIALVEGDVAPVADGDIDLATFALGPALMLPRLEILSRRKNDDLAPSGRSEEHTSELQSLMRLSYAVFCLKKKQPHTRL